MQGEQFVALRGHGTGDRAGGHLPVALDTAETHAAVGAGEVDPDACGIECVGHRVGDLSGEILLDVEAGRQGVEKARDLGKANAFTDGM